MRTGEAAAKANQTRELLLVAVAAAVAATNAGAALGGASGVWYTIREHCTLWPHGFLWSHQ